MSVDLSFFFLIDCNLAESLSASHPLCYHLIVFLFLWLLN